MSRYKWEEFENDSQIDSIADKFADNVPLEIILKTIEEDLTSKDYHAHDHEKELLMQYIEQRFDVLPF